MSPRIALAVILSVACGVAQAQLPWPKGKQAAIVLTYDDALRSQLEFVVPQLAAARLHGTFFLDGDIKPVDMRLWRAVERAGHELGNHSVYHPCPRAMLPDRAQYLTDNYDVAHMLAEIGVMNNVLYGIDGKETRTYSVPCSQTLVGGIDYLDGLRRSGLVKCVRNGGDQYNSVITDFATLDRFNVPSWGPVDHPDGAQLIAYADRVHAAHGLGVFQFHGVGGDYLEVSAQAHRDLTEYLRRHPDIWVDTFEHVMDYVDARSR
jgi:peptidoglycan/xylan/chitin deacetylase (PgdA/CDA1 family)